MRWWVQAILWGYLLLWIPLNFQFILWSSTPSMVLCFCNTHCVNCCGLDLFRVPKEMTMLGATFDWRLWSWEWGCWSSVNKKWNGLMVKYRRLCYWRVFPSGLAVKNLSAMQKMRERWVWSWVLEGSLQEGMVTHFTMSGESHGKRSLAGYSPLGCKELDKTEVTDHAHTCYW